MMRLYCHGATEGNVSLVRLEGHRVADVRFRVARLGHGAQAEVCLLDGRGRFAVDLEIGQSAQLTVIARGILDVEHPAIRIGHRYGPNWTRTTTPVGDTTSTDTPRITWTGTNVDRAAFKTLASRFASSRNHL